MLLQHVQSGTQYDDKVIRLNGYLIIKGTNLILLELLKYLKLQTATPF